MSLVDGDLLPRYRITDFPLTGSIVARKRDIDHLGHLNNVAIAAYYEESRAWLGRETHSRLSADSAASLTLLIVRLTIDYLAEGFYPGTYDLGIGVSHIGRSSMIWSTALFDEQRLIGGCDAIHANRSPTGGAAVIPVEVRAVFGQYRGPSVLRPAPSRPRSVNDHDS